MIFPYEVKYNGEYYKAGENVPMEETKDKLEKTKEVTVEEIEPAVDTERVETEQEPKKRGRKAKSED